MEIEYRDKKLALVETDEAHTLRLPVSVINSLRSKIHIIRSAPDVRTLRNWKSLHFEKLAGKSGEERWSIRINIQWRLVFELETDRQPNKLIALSVEDYH